MKNDLVAKMVAFFALAVSGCGGGGSSYGGSTPVAVTMSPANGTALPNATVGQVYSQTFTVVSGGVAPYVLAPTGVPAGLAWSSTPSSGTLSGTPSQIGAAIFQITITDSTGQQAQVGYPLTIQAAGALTITPSSLASGTVGSAYSQTIQVIGGTAPYTFTTQGNLPPGITLGPGGASGQAVFSGTPVASGSYTFTTNVADSSSPTQKGSIPYTITIQ